MLASCREPLTVLQESLQGLELCLRHFLELTRIESYSARICVVDKSLIASKVS